MKVAILALPALFAGAFLALFAAASGTVALPANAQRAQPRLEVAIQGVIDPATSTNEFNQPEGRYVVVDWSITNVGETDADWNALYLKIQTQNGRVYSLTNAAGLPEPHLSIGTLPPGGVVRGYLAYDIPTDQALALALYAPIGAAQRTVADFGAGVALPACTTP